MSKRTFPAEYAILGLLSDGALHGYALRKRLDAALAPFWTIATSQIYSALHSIENKGLVNVDVQIQNDRPPRNVYLITPKGREEFERWCTGPVRHLRDMRVEFLAKLYFLRRKDDDAALSLIDVQRVFLERLRTRVLQRKNLTLDDATLSELAARFRAYQMTAAIDWLNECKKVLLQKTGGDKNGTRST